MKKITTWALCLFSALVLVLSAGCASIGATPAKSFDQQLAYGYATVTAVRTSAADALNVGTIQITDAQHVLIVTDTARAGLDVARTSSAAGDTSTALGKLTEATAILTAAQSFLISHGVKQ